MSQNIEHVSINLNSDVISEHLSDYVTRVLCNDDYFIANLLRDGQEMRVTVEIHPVVLRVCALNTEDCSMRLGLESQSKVLVILTNSIICIVMK